MKRIFTIIAATIAAFAIASCSKEPVSEQQSKVTSLNITVGEFGGTQTKAAKTGWVSGDQVYIWYAGKDNQEFPDLVIEYDGSNWNIESETTVSGKAPNAAGALHVVYMSDYSGLSHKYVYGRDHYTVPHYAGGVEPCMPLCVKTPIQGVPYTFADGVLSSNLDSWEFLTCLKVLIKTDGRMNKAANNYRLRIYNPNDSSNKNFNSVVAGFTWDGEKIASAGGNDDIAYVAGVKESDGIAFYFPEYTADNDGYPSYKANIEFQLSKYNATTKQCAFNKHVNATKDKMVNIALSYSSFN